jgi:hypothetical protein
LEKWGMENWTASKAEQVLRKKLGKAQNGTVR